MRAAVLGLSLLAAVPLVIGAPAAALAQPTPPKPDFAAAGAHYKAAEAAMTTGNYADAAAGYQAAYDITKDPVLFYKIAGAHEKAGRCDLAVPLFARYLVEGKPSAEFVTLTTTRQAGCEQLLADKAAADKAAADKAAADKAAADKAAADKAAALAPPSPAPPSGPSDGSLSASSGRSGLAWGLAGGAVGFATLGILTALAAESTEDDITDLLGAQVGGQPAPFTETAQAEYDDLVDRGDRYEKLAWISFGVAGAAAVGAIVVFALPKPAARGAVYPARSAGLTLTPVVSTTGAGLRGSFSF